MNILPLLLQLLSGLVGGNLVGAASEKLNLGILINSLLGIIGGGVGGRIFEQLTDVDSLDSTGASIFLASVAGGCAGGAIAVCIAAWVRNLRGIR
jgi:uncharacterized membrane protein YeaQ/YmgE (transglycosylase-associated protein family)